MSSLAEDSRSLGKLKLAVSVLTVRPKNNFFIAGSEVKHFSSMGNFCSSFRAVFKLNEGTGLTSSSPTRGSTRKPDGLPKPPATVDGTTKSMFHVLPSDKLHLTVYIFIFMHFTSCGFAKIKQLKWNKKVRFLKWKETVLKGAVVA